MNLQPLYDLKERLEYAAIAGTGLMQEDFRLRRAVEALAPLAGANPVFAKIAAAAKALPDAPKEARSRRLLDVLSLVDAVVYTQGVSNLSGSLTPIQPGSGTYVEVSYGQLKPLVQALTGSGSGRMNLIQNGFEEHSAYFSDFRVLPHVLDALGDNYAELADLAASILMKQGSAIVPLLKDGFDPAGKSDMVRRVHLVARLAGADENDWFVSILPDSTKNVREAVIQALGLCQDNSRLLLDLCRSEKGKLKEAVLRSLSRMKDPACVDQLRREVSKKPMKIGFLKGVDSAIAADLAADALRKRIEAFPTDQKLYDMKERDSLIELTALAANKYSPAMAQFWHWVAPQMDRLSHIVVNTKSCMCEFSVAEHMQKCLMQAVLRNPWPELCALARSLASEYPQWFLGAAFLADMAELPPEAVYEKYAPLIAPGRTFLRNEWFQIISALYPVRWSESHRCYTASFWCSDSLTGQDVKLGRKIRGVDPRWLRILTDPGMEEKTRIYDLSQPKVCSKTVDPLDSIICGLMDADNPEVCELVGAWLYRVTRNTGHFRHYMNPLLRCGWKEWEGLLVHCVGMQKRVIYDHVMEWLQQVPMSNAAKAEELRQVAQLVKSGTAKVSLIYWPETEVSAVIAALEADPNWQIVWRRFI